MKINCIYCKTDFICEDKKVNSMKSIIKCGNCSKEWDYKSITTELEKKIDELDIELENNENRIINEKKFNLEKIEKLEHELKYKNIELNKQKLIEDRLYLYEQRLTRSEKQNSEQAILEDKIFKLREEINKSSSEISIKNKEIDRRTNYLTMKAKEENKATPKLRTMNEKISSTEFDKKNINKKKTPHLKKYNFWKT